MTMQFKQQREQQQNIKNLQSYLQSQQSLINSRKRLNCQASERSSQLDYDNQNQIKEFRRQIEERFKLSIANKIYTFPKMIKSIHDIISSSESSQPQSSLQRTKYDKDHQNNNIRHFKKKSNKNIEESKPKYQDSSSKNKKNGESTNYVQSLKKGKDKLITEFIPKKRQQKQKRQQKDKKQQRYDKQKPKEQKIKVKIQRNDKCILKKSKTKRDRLKTENQSSKSFIQTMKSKNMKKN